MNGINKRTKIGVLLGGLSSERDVSIQSGENVLKALSSLGYDVLRIDVNKALPVVLREHDVQAVFNALHGRYGEDGAVQGLLEIMGIPYTGSGVTASAIAMDKLLTKHILTSAGILTPPYIVIDKADIPYESVLEESGINLPYVVKPSKEGSSVGISVVSSPSQLKEALDIALKYSDRVLIEHFIEGRDITVAIYRNKVLGSMEIETPAGFLDYDSKYTPGKETFFIPPRIPAEVIKAAEEDALKAHNLIGCDFYSRIDFRAAPGGRVYMLEINTLPGLTHLSHVPKIAESIGMKYDELIEGVVKSARLKGGNG